MDEEKNSVDNSSLENSETKTYSYHFNPDERSEVESYDEDNQQKDFNQKKYIGGYQLNHGKTLAKSISSGKSSVKYPYGIRGNWSSSGIISILGIAIILGILAFIVTFVFVS